MYYFKKNTQLVKINSITLVLKILGKRAPEPLTPHIHEFNATKIVTVILENS